jgi:hypothetical protein
MEKKQQANSISGWIMGKTNAIRVFFKKMRRTRQLLQTQKRKDTDGNASFYLLKTQAHTIRSLL